MIRRAPIVLLYHRVVDLDADPQELAVAPANFRAQLSVLKDVTTPVPLAEAAGDRTPRSVITFDDGYEDNALFAVPALEESGTPATFFITSGGIGTEFEMWWDRLEALMHHPTPGVPVLELDSHGIRLWSDVRDEAGRARTYWALFWRLRPLPVDAIRSVLDEVESILDVTVAPRRSHRMMGLEQLRGVSESGFEIGAHTVSHPFLSAQPVAVQRRETADCKAALEDMTGAPVKSFSYPFGGPDAVSAQTVQHVQSAGYARACLVGRHSPAGITELETPRQVVGNWTGDEFERRLRAWLAE